MFLILQAGGGHGHSHSSVLTHTPRRVTNSVDDSELHFEENNDDVVTMTTCTTSTDSSSNINVKAALIHVIGDLLQSFGVLVAAYIIFYKVFVYVIPHTSILCGKNLVQFSLSVGF